MDRQPARVLGEINMATAKESRRNNLVQGMMTAHDAPSLLLFDSSCTLSFISYKLVRELNMKPNTLDPSLLVKTPNGHETLVHKEVGLICVKIQNVL